MATVPTRDSAQSFFFGNPTANNGVVPVHRSVDDRVDREIDNELLEILRRNCKAYKVLPRHYVQAIENPKASAFIRGICAEIDAEERLASCLSRDIWLVSRPNDNAQPGKSDRDIMVTHLPTGKSKTLESKCTNRGSLAIRRRHGLSATVKLHKSRIAMNKAYDRDKYHVDHCDVVVTNLFNAVAALNQSGNFKAVDNQDALAGLASYLKIELTGVEEVDHLRILDAAMDTFLYACTRDLSKDSIYIDKSPVVQLVQSDDLFSVPLVWHPINEIENTLLELMDVNSH